MTGTRIGAVRPWRSLIAHRAVATRLLGPAGEKTLEVWLAQLLEGLLRGAAQRLLAEGEIRLLAELRHLGGDPGQPFVDALAWCAPEQTAETTDQALRRLAARAWAEAAPADLRFLLPQGAPQPLGARLDLTVHAAAYESMAAPARATRALLERFDAAEDAIELVRAAYAQLHAAQPELARRVPPAPAQDVARWWREGRLWAIRDRADPAEIAGLIAVEPGEIGWLEGDMIAEEAVLRRFGGKGLAAEAQRALAKMKRDAAAPGRLLIGTIDAGNHASRKTALRAGRPEAMRYVLAALPGAAE